ncbi:translocase subunit-like [Solea senegalensis]|uniref:Translocase subunit-like n=1 Tax=Solea senegalensis TaxID=28829 RepID=A0AAV6QVV0_SOLSE|nr:translocase subunit-like [Solea senegalensis]
MADSDHEKLLLDKLKGLVTNINWTPAEVDALFEALLKRFESTNRDRSHLVLWMLKMLHCIQIHFITPRWKSTGQSGKTLIQLVQDQGVTNEDLKKCLGDDKEKDLDTIIEEMRQKLDEDDKKLLNEAKDIVSSVSEALASDEGGAPLIGLKLDLLRLCEAARKTRFRPRPTQMVSWCLMALSKTGRLIQVGTGEGKSCIVAMFAAFRATRGEKVDIMTSSSVLAERDLKEWKEFYEVLNISVDCNTNKSTGELKKCYNCQVVYGTVEEFAGDWLKHHFERMDIFGQRKFQCAIVDEVDSLMLDKGLHAVYLSSDMPALRHLSPLLAFIWATTNQYGKTRSGTILGPKLPFHQVVLKATGKDADEFTVLQMAEDTGLLAKGSVSDIKSDSRMKEKTKRGTVSQLAEFFKKVEKNFLCCRFALRYIDKDGAIKELSKESTGGNEERQGVLLLDGGLCQLMYPDEEGAHRASEEEVRSALCFTPCEVSKDKSSCYVPGFLSDLVESKLKVWIENAFYSQTLTKGHEYTVEEHGITPVDYSCTGVVENFRQWTDGLHQFLEIKHKCKMTDMKAITNFKSNVGMLQQYKDQIYGLSGTLGQQAETETFQNIYEGIKTCHVPSFKRRKLFEVEGVIVSDEREWIEETVKVVVAEINPTPYRQGRAALIVCETINRAQALHDRLGEAVPSKKLYINNNRDNTPIFAKKLDAGEVIVATNLAGRGTDLQVSERVKAAGGLFVVQNFLPKNARVEAQAFGRAARQGSPGSAQLIVCNKYLSESLQLKKLLQSLEVHATSLCQDLFMRQLRLYPTSHSNDRSKDLCETLSLVLSENSMTEIKASKKFRDHSAALKLARYLEHDFLQIKKKEDVFTHHLATLEEVYKSENGNPSASYVSALNEFWGMWLLTEFKTDQSVTELKSRLSRDLDTAQQKLKNRESPSSNLHHYTTFGNELLKEGNLAESIRMYTKAIEQDHHWAAIAYYNRAFASLNLRQDPNGLNQALGDLRNALKSLDHYSEQAEATRRYATQQTNEPDRDSRTRFEDHINARLLVLQFLKDEIIKATETINQAKIGDGILAVLKCHFMILLPLEHISLLIERSVETLLHRHDHLRIQQIISGPKFDIVSELMSLASLGLTHVYYLHIRLPVRAPEQSKTSCHIS